jgi:hypothetical protein
MSIFKKVLFFSLFAGLSVSQIFAEPDPNFHIYLLFGQSNMAGGGAGNYDGEGTKGVGDYCDTNSRVKVLAWGDCNAKPYPCPDKQLKRTHDQWYTAFPPYHNCQEGIGPADGFGRTLLDSIRQDITICFIPCALSGQEIAVFKKGGGVTIESYTQPSPQIGNDGYSWMVKRCKIAQQSGVIKGILLHQGEADNGRAGWTTDVKGILDNLKKDLGLWDSIPFVAGELRYDGCCPDHNKLVKQLPGIIPNCAVASANGLERRLSRVDGTVDQYHFSTKGFKDLGFRFAEALLKIADDKWIPRKGSVKVATPRIVPHQKINLTAGTVSIYSLDGNVISTFNKITTENALRSIKVKGVYIVSRKLENGENFVVPFVKN